MKIQDGNKWKDPDFCLAAVQQTGLTLEFCLAAITQNKNASVFVKH